MTDCKVVGVMGMVLTTKQLKQGSGKVISKTNHFIKDTTFIISNILVLATVCSNKDIKTYMVINQVRRCHGDTWHILNSLNNGVMILTECSLWKGIYLIHM